jgi:cytidine deaminase
MDDIQAVLIEKAKNAMKLAYAPYSNFRVGAALLAGSGKIYTGCNDENMSFGATNCAERTAVFKAVSEGERSFKAIAVYSSGNSATAPCGICRQVLSEFSDDIAVFFCGTDEKIVATTLSALLPMPHIGLEKR